MREIKGTGDEIKLLAKVISKSTDQKLTEKVDGLNLKLLLLIK